MKRVCTVVIALLITALAAPRVAAQRVLPLERAHAHNDYSHDRPLLDALALGFCSVEADIFLVDDKLLVAHDLDKTDPEKTLQALYLEPLKQRVEKNGGRVYPDGPTIILLIDIKSSAEATYLALQKVLAEYADMLTRFTPEGMEEGAVTVIVSGNRPYLMMKADRNRLAGYDGRLDDLRSREPAHFMPLISDRWGGTFKWNGRGEMPEAERQRLHEIVKQAHDKGRKVRFWAIPHREALWDELFTAGVDLINADLLDKLQAFLLRKKLSELKGSRD